MADQHEQQTGQPVFRMQKMYIKDLSFESPHAPQVIHDFHTCCLRIIHPCSRHSCLIPGKSDIQQIRRTSFIVHAGASICLIPTYLNIDEQRTSNCTCSA